MPRMTPEAHLASAPAPVRAAMLADRAALEPGAAAVVGRFFDEVTRRGEAVSAPSAATFRAVAGSEPTFRCLLRALAAYAPQVSTAAALEVKRAWVAARPRPARSPRRTPSPAPAWPESWRRLWPDLERALTRESTRARYRASIDRCAQCLAHEQGDPGLGFLTAVTLAEDFTEHADEERRVAPVTAANYIEALISLGRHGGVDRASLAAMQVVRRDLRGRARAREKRKVARIEALMDRGGFDALAERLAELRDEVDRLPAHAARRTRCLQAIVLCLVLMNKPARTGDVARWRLGEELVRERDGTWRLAWSQSKTGRADEAGALWPEVGAALDAHLLNGRPARLIRRRYADLHGRNWLTFEPVPCLAKAPSALVKWAIGVPAHDLRTLAADTLRRHDPAQAPDVIAAHLGHATAAAGAAYRAICDGEAAAKDWARDRARLSETGGVVTMKTG